MPLRVLIAGAGLGGLTLAHGLRNSGLDVAVFECDPRPASPAETYRIQIDANGSRALHACLAPELWTRLDALAANPPRGVAFTTEDLHQLAFIAEARPTPDPVAHARPISRRGLRQLLLSGLEDVVTFDKRLKGYDQPGDRQVRAHFADGGSASGDVLVGADGSASAVRKQLLPAARVVDTGVAGIAGKVYLTDSLREGIPGWLLDQMTMVLPTRRLAMFLAPFQRTSGSQQDRDLDMAEHLFWVVLGRPDDLGLARAMRLQPAAELQALAQQRVARWHPLLPWLVSLADPRSLVAVPLHTSVPVSAWPTTNVTLLGDAIHTMPPLQGLGGNTALRDAALLRRRLVEADRGQVTLVEAIRAYETSMLDYGFEAVRRSVQVTDGIASTSMLGRMAFRTALRVADKLPPLRRALFQRPAA